MRKQTQAGVTLIELIVVMMIMSIIAVIGAKILATAFKDNVSTRNLIDADWQPRVALERMARDIRAVQNADGITTISATQLVFMDTNGNTITYSLSGTSLMRQLNSTTSQILADGVQSLAFIYYDKTGAVTAVAANVRYIEFTLVINLNNTSFTISSGVNLRNVV